MQKPYGYLVPDGYFGKIDGKFILFETEQEYLDALEERNSQEEESE